ncbi:hypothetical protein DINM_022977 [Dirofilaria immitis]|nr:hypothetical protein [Dirofilaria immitis]
MDTGEIGELTEILEQSSSPYRSPQRRSTVHSLSISSSITARSPFIYASTTKQQRLKNPFMNGTYFSMANTNSVSLKRSKERMRRVEMLKYLGIFCIAFLVALK